MSRTKKPPRRFKTEDELTPKERSKRLAGVADRFETPEYREFRADVLADAGIEEDLEAIEADLDEIAEEDLTPQERFERLNERA